MTRLADAALTVSGIDGMPEVAHGDDLAALAHARTPSLATGDILVVTSKVVSKAEGRVVETDRETAIRRETSRVVARRGPTTIARTSHGLTLAAAGVDATNTTPGTVVLLPVDPDRSARDVRTRLWEHAGVNVAVVVSDTAGRTWRLGQTDIAIGCAGLDPIHDLAGRHDAQGNPLSVTAPAVADEIAGTADLVMGKLAGRPLAVVRGLGHLVLAAGVHGPGASALVRAEEADMFALGTREAVQAAVCRDDPDARAALGALASSEGDPVPVEVLVRQTHTPAATLDIRVAEGHRVEVSGHDDIPTAAALERLCALAVVHGWQVEADDRNLGSCRIVLRAVRGTS